MVRAAGSYPAGHKFESHRRYHDYNTEFSFYIWPVGQAVKTPPFHGGNMGSSPVRVTKKPTNENSVIHIDGPVCERMGICLRGGNVVRKILDFL